jgi:hypothetical protein
MSAPLSTAGGTVYLAMLMWSYFEDYVTDAGPGPLAEAYGRFPAWPRRDGRSRTAS